MANAEKSGEPRILGRYAIYDAIASGGMATVHCGRLIGPEGFSRTVAIKCLHPQYAQDPDFVTMFLDEARMAAQIGHPNVVGTLDVVTEGDEIFLVMDYVHGESLGRLLRELQRRGERVPFPVALRIGTDILQGLHAAHEAKDEKGVALQLVHRDVSPQNILLGVDGVARLVDFGVAKAGGRAHATRDGNIKGKIGYMAPEQLRSEPVTRQADIHAFSVVLWEMIAGQRLFAGDSETEVFASVMRHQVPLLSRVVAVPAAIDAVVACGVDPDLGTRFATAREMCIELGRCGPVAQTMEVADWAQDRLREILAPRDRMVSVIERDKSSIVGKPPAEKVTSGVMSARDWKPTGADQASDHRVHEDRTVRAKSPSAPFLDEDIDGGPTFVSKADPSDDDGIDGGVTVVAKAEPSNDDVDDDGIDGGVTVVAKPGATSDDVDDEGIDGGVTVVAKPVPTRDDEEEDGIDGGVTVVSKADPFARDDLRGGPVVIAAHGWRAEDRLDAPTLTATVSPSPIAAPDAWAPTNPPAHGIAEDERYASAAASPLEAPPAPSLRAPVPVSPPLARAAPPAATAPSGPRMLLWGAAGSAGAVAFLLAAWVVHASMPGGPTVGAIPDASDPPAVDAAVASAAPALPPAVASAPAEVPLPDASAAPAGQAPTATQRPATPQPPARPARGLPGRNKPNCNPPYTLDSAGVRVPKRGCAR